MRKVLQRGVSAPLDRILAPISKLESWKILFF